ncbi:MAG: helix-turn-helix domain-containing protein [Actinobacteria bacterium]|nr:helix-turn-helix domain-containing protein [Actinomycetota bacterium]
MPRETSQTLDRGLKVLELLAELPEGLTVTEIAGRLGVSRTVVYRLVVTLEQHGLLRRGADGRAHTGLAVLALARHVQPLLRESAVPVLRRLADSTGATAVLTIAEADDALTVAAVEPSRSELHVALKLGTRVPLERSAPGRAIISARQHRALEHGWVVGTGEPDSGAWTLAAPLVGVPGVDAAVSVVGVGDVRAAAVGPSVLAAAADTARALR